MSSLYSQTVSHELVISNLTQMVSAKKLPNTLLFSGEKSVGKFKVALGLAQNILCETRQACGQCSSCLRVSKKQHESLSILGSEEAVIKVDKAREVTQFLSKKLNENEFKVVIIDGAEKLNNQSANALLKTLEEPPENCFIILVTSALFRLLPTIRSRGQIIRFGSLNKEQINQIEPVEDWLFDICGPNLNLIEDLKDPQIIEVYKGLSESINSLDEQRYNHSLKLIEPIIKNKQQVFTLVQALQQLVKLSYFKKIKLPCDHTAWQAGAVDKLFNLSPSNLLDLFQESIKMEYYMTSNFDMLLVFETFYLKLISYFKGEATNVRLDRYSYTP